MLDRDLPPDARHCSKCHVKPGDPCVSVNGPEETHGRALPYFHAARRKGSPDRGPIE